MQYRKQNVADMLRRCGYRQLADEALRGLPDLIDSDELQKWGAAHGVTRSDLIDHMSGSP